MASSYHHQQRIPSEQPSMRWMSFLALTLKLVQEGSIWWYLIRANDNPKRSRISRVALESDRMYLVDVFQNKSRTEAKRTDFLTLKIFIAWNIRLHNKIKCYTIKKNINFILVLFWGTELWNYVMQNPSSDRFSDSPCLETILLQRNNTRAPRNNVVRLTNTWEISLKLRSSCSR